MIASQDPTLDSKLSRNIITAPSCKEEYDLKIDDGHNVNINAVLSKLQSEEDIGRWLNVQESRLDKIESITYSGSKLQAESLIQVLGPILDARRLRYLLELTISYVHLPEALQTRLCEQLNPFVGGWRIKRLNVTRCQLGVAGTLRLLQSMKENVTIEEVILTGNACSDASVPALLENMINYRNSIHTLGLNNNQLTANGIRPIVKLLGSEECKIRSLYLGSNPRIGHSLLPDLFVAVANKHSRLKVLDLSNCRIHNCEWARFLPFVRALERLDIAHNLIDDNEFVKLCKGLETCFSIRHLNLSYNRFWGSKCNVIQQLIESNKALLSLNISGNRFVDEVWLCVQYGLRRNETLCELDVSSSNLNLKNALLLCEAFTVNDSCTMVLHGNPLPEDMISDARDYCQELQYKKQTNNGDQLHETPLEELIRTGSRINTGRAVHQWRLLQSSSEANVNLSIETEQQQQQEQQQFQSLRADAAVRALARSAEWIASRRDLVESSLAALDIMQEKADADAAAEMAAIAVKLGISTEVLTAMMQGKVDGNNEDAPAASTSHISSSSSNGSSSSSSSSSSNTTSSSMGGDTGGRIPHDADDNNNKQEQEQASSVSLLSGREAVPALSTAKGLMEKSEQYIPPEQLRRLVIEADQVNNPESKMIHVAYGRAPLIIGHVKVTNMTTYTQIRKPIVPLVRSYLETMADEARQQQLTENFKLMDPTGAVVDDHSAAIRRVWAELCMQETDTIVVRPANWLSLD